MKTIIKTRYEKLKAQEVKIHAKLWRLETEKEEKTEELKDYCKWKRLSWEGLETTNVKAQKLFYKYMDDKYPVVGECGLRCENRGRGMGLFYWLDDDPDYMIIHIASDSSYAYFGGSTSWLAFAPTLEDKVALIKNIKKQFLTFIKEEG